MCVVSVDCVWGASGKSDICPPVWQVGLAPTFQREGHKTHTFHILGGTHQHLARVLHAKGSPGHTVITHCNTTSHYSHNLQHSTSTADGGEHLNQVPQHMNHTGDICLFPTLATIHLSRPIQVCYATLRASLYTVCHWK